MNRIRLSPALIFPVVFILLIVGSQVTGQDQPTTAPTNTSSSYAGSEQCASCHEDLAKAIDRTAHGEKGFRMRTDKGCESCHGRGQAHVESGGDPTLIRSFKKLSTEEASETCLTCHENGKQMLWKGSVHQQRDLGCASCHSVHAPRSETAQLKKATVEQSCFECHLPIKAQLQRTSHHPIREGLMSCSDCHNPHGTDTPKMITATSVNEQCYTCHTEKRGPFLWEHPPVKENCLTCHTAHGSSHPKLMVQKRPYICQNCHLDTRHPGTLYDRSTLFTSNREFARACSNCHLTVHGSNHPSGWTFTR